MSTSKARTHDISLVDYHVKDLETFGQTLTSAAAAAFPKDGRPRYEEVHTLLLSWEDDILGVNREIAELEDVLKTVYNYKTLIYRIPSRRSHNSLATQISGFLEENESKDNLLIVYYGGHGGMNDDRQCIWSCTSTPGTPTVKWAGLQTMFEEADSDVLILLDCCAAASSTADGGNGVTELIAACGFETWAPGVSEHSFTRSLIDELRYCGGSPSLSAAMLHSKVLSRMKYWKPRFGPSGNHEHRKTPIHIQLANKDKKRSIELGRLPCQAVLLSDDAADLSHSPSSHSSAESMEAIGGVESTNTQSSQSSQSQVWSDRESDLPKVLISVALEEDQYLLTNEWAEWLERIPAIVKFARVEGVYHSSSTLMLLSVPVAVWDYIPKNPAINFIAFVRSSNLCILTHPSPSTVQDDTKNDSPMPDTEKAPTPREAQHSIISNRTKHVKPIHDPLEHEFSRPDDYPRSLDSSISTSYRTKALKVGQALLHSAINSYLVEDEDLMLLLRLAPRYNRPVSKTYDALEYYGDNLSESGTSKMVFGSDFTDRSSLPYLERSRDSSEASSLRYDGRVAPILTRGKVPDQDVVKKPANLPPLHGTEESHVLECPFNFIQCYEKFSPSNEREWIKHSLDHFVIHGKRSEMIDPPKTNQCCFCDVTFQDPSGVTSWRDRMQHVKLHQHPLAAASHDRALINYLWQQGVLSPAQYSEARVDPRSSCYKHLSAEVKLVNDNRRR